MSCEFAFEFQGLGKEIFTIGRKCALTQLYCSNWSSLTLLQSCPERNKIDRVMQKERK